MLNSRVLRVLIYLKRLLNSLKCLVIKHEAIKDPLLYMTILAKNEADVIEKNLIFHKRMGIDGFIVTDNNSSDGTTEILERYLKKGWIKEIIYETSNVFTQVEWVDRMISIAKDKYKADWVVNADADEFWYSSKNDLKSDIKGARNNIFKVNIYNVLPENELCFFDNVRLINITQDLSTYNLSEFSMYGKQIPKVIHRTKGYRLITEGNHSVDMSFSNEILSKDVIIFHYSLRGEEHFKRKMISGGESVERALKKDKKIAMHWMYFYKLLQGCDVNVTDEYRKVVGSDYIDEFQEMGVFASNNGVRDILRAVEADD